MKMDRPVFPVQRSILAAPALAERILPRFDLPGPAICRFWQRSINDAYLVEMEGARFILRVSPANWRSHAHVAAEVDLLRFLLQQGITVPRPIEQKDGTYVQTLNAPEGLRYAVLFAFLPGDPIPHNPTEAQCHLYGQAIAQLHGVTNSYPLDRAGWRFEPQDMVDRPLARLEPLFVDHQDDFAYLVEISGDLKRAAGELSHEPPAYGICHGDVNKSNIHLIEDDRWALLDFEYFGYGWRVFDIGNFVNNQLYALGRTERGRGVLDAFLAGYQSVRRLSPAELEALSSFVVLRQIWLLGIGAKNMPNFGLGPFQDWCFNRCIPIIRSWMDEPWY